VERLSEEHIRNRRRSTFYTGGIPLDKVRSTMHCMTFKRNGQSVAKGMKLALMTATPGDTVEDVVKLMNILRRPGAPDLKWTDDRDVQVFLQSSAWNGIIFRLLL
jgi:hypothetical protein